MQNGTQGGAMKKNIFRNTGEDSVTCIREESPQRNPDLNMKKGDSHAEKNE